ncbi:hypothetical protein [Adhaeribacter pallidiroseus]|uniref:Uncharacterized protein n=1 Tax=Adhaeribacter pallidiroseus TaxID=2072847 RepID=A0A369QIB4_9BACT|nr:hypothetical protein [Adhaeribacter pallidiroseus]RDC64152.1 hypothetical protein AHMF7616_02763 [Adhaeribacter pallidiroseus]
MGNKIVVNKSLGLWRTSAWVFGLAVLTVGLLNLFLVHPVPGTAYLLLALVYLPPANAYFAKRFNFSIPLVVKIMLGLLLFLFTLGVSDLGDIMDKL